MGYGDYCREVPPGGNENVRPIVIEVMMRYGEMEGEPFVVESERFDSVFRTFHTYIKFPGGIGRNVVFPLEDFNKLKMKMCYVELSAV